MTMCIIHVPISDAYELSVTTQRTGDDVTLTVRQFIPISNHPEDHQLMQVTLPLAKVKEIGYFLAHES
jgi:hypothetical protein